MENIVRRATSSQKQKWNDALQLEYKSADLSYTNVEDKNGLKFDKCLEVRRFPLNFPV